MRAPIIFALLVAVALAPTRARAQVSIAAVVGQSSQADGKSDSPYLGPGFGGSALAGIGMGDVAVGSHVSVGGEMSLASDISGIQSERVPGGSNHLVSDHHDSIFTAVLKIGTPASERVRIAGVIGSGVAHRHTERRGTFQSSNTTTPQPVLEVLTDNVWALDTGLDLAVGLTDHLALIGAGRLYLLKDDDLQPDGVVKRGVASTIFRFGGGLQVRF